MQKDYQTPEMEIIVLDNLDVVCASGDPGDNDSSWILLGE